MLVASSPEILCRVDKERTVVNRPLAGRACGKTQEEDEALEVDLLAPRRRGTRHSSTSVATTSDACRRLDRQGGETHGD